MPDQAVWADITAFLAIQVIEASANYYSVISAEYNWWGAYPPAAGEFYSNLSTLDYNYPLTYDPNPSLMKRTKKDNEITGISESFFDDDLLLAQQYRTAGKYDEAVKIYKSIFEKETASIDNKNSQRSRYSLANMEECLFKAGKSSDFKDYIDKSIRPNISKMDDIYSMTLELENHNLIHTGEYNKAIDNLNILLANFKDNPETYKYTLFNMGLIYRVFKKDTLKAAEYFTELQKKYPDDWLVVIKNNLFSDILETTGMEKLDNNANNNSNKNNEEKEESISEKIALGNYPNPFNPSTKILYTIPENSKVKLVIYNALGQEVETLVNKEQTAGKYEVTWNPKNIASGVYYYRLSVNNHSEIKKLIFMKQTLCYNRDERLKNRKETILKYSLRFFL